MMDIQLVPYCEIDGIRSFSDSEIAELYDRMEKDGTAEMVFYDRGVQSRTGFVALMRRPGTYLYIVVPRSAEGVTEPLAIVWLTQVESKRAYMHFCLFSNAWGESSVEIGKATVVRLINMKDGKDQYLFDVFYGITPMVNTDAIRYAEFCGGKVVFSLPCGVWNGAKKANETGIFIQYLREQDKGGS